VEDRRNIVTAILLMGLILIGWPIVSGYLFPAPPKPAVTAPAKTEGANAPAASAQGGDVGTPTTAAVKDVPLPTALAANPRVIVKTPKLSGSINLEGAKLDDLVMLAHRQDLAKNSPPVRLFSPSGTKDAYFARFGWTNPEGQLFEIKLSIDSHYMISAEQRFTNAAGLPTANVAPRSIISRKGVPKDATKGGSIFTQIHIGPMGVFNDKPNYKWGYDQVSEENNGTVSIPTTGGWSGFTDKYWLAALIPDQKVPVKAEYISKDGYNWALIYNAKLTPVEPGKSTSQTSRLFAGAKEYEELRNYTNKLGIPYLDYSIDWGWFWFIAIPFHQLLLWLFKMTTNFGVAIICLTLIVRTFMFPVAQKQFASMAAMRVVQPKMKALQDRYKDDKPKLQQEMMKLYQEEKVNPLGGTSRLSCG
jgi:YidC/Oxa1 family membrane protein insertase